MDLRDMFGSMPNRPDHPDFWKLTEISLRLRAITQELQGNVPAQWEAWQASYEEIGDFASIQYHAIHTCMSIHGIETNLQWAEMMRDKRKHNAFISSVQGFFDGFMLGAKFAEGKETP